MGQLISLYNHPDFDKTNLSDNDISILFELWHAEDRINDDNGAPRYDMRALEIYLGRAS